MRDALIQHKGASPEQAELLAGLSGGRIGWAIRALEDPSILEQRDHALTLLENLLDVTRAKRFEVADDLSKDKLALYPLLELWQSYWRDVVLMCENAPVPPANRDRGEAIERLSARLTADEALAALEATRTMLKMLSLNVNLRLALEVMFLDYPGLRKA